MTKARERAKIKRVVNKLNTIHEATTTQTEEERR